MQGKYTVCLAKLTEIGDIVIELGSVLYIFMFRFSGACELSLYPQCFPQNKRGIGREMVVCLWTGLWRIAQWWKTDVEIGLATAGSTFHITKGDLVYIYMNMVVNSDIAVVSVWQPPVVQCIAEAISL